jgi:hypothetical protein
MLKKGAIPAAVQRKLLSMPVILQRSVRWMDDETEGENGIVAVRNQLYFKFHVSREDEELIACVSLGQ